MKEAPASAGASASYFFLDLFLTFFAFAFFAMTASVVSVDESSLPLGQGAIFCIDHLSTEEGAIASFSARSVIVGRFVGKIPGIQETCDDPSGLSGHCICHWRVAATPTVTSSSGV